MKLGRKGGDLGGAGGGGGCVQSTLLKNKGQRRSVLPQCSALVLTITDRKTSFGEHLFVHMPDFRCSQ